MIRECLRPVFTSKVFSFFKISRFFFRFLPGIKLIELLWIASVDLVELISIQMNGHKLKSAKNVQTM